MEKKEDIVYFELNNWRPGKDYPNVEPFKSWIGDDLSLRFYDELWVKNNKLVVVAATVDQSVNFLVTTTKKWVEKNCPELLTKYSNFMNIPEKGEKVPYARFYGEFLEYTKENIGIHYDDSWFEDN